MAMPRLSAEADGPASVPGTTPAPIRGVEGGAPVKTVGASGRPQASADWMFLPGLIAATLLALVVVGLGGQVSRSAQAGGMVAGAFLIGAVLRGNSQSRARQRAAAPPGLEERLSLACHSCTIPMVLTDVSGRIEWANPAFAALVGPGFEPAVGRDLSALESCPTDSDAGRASRWSILQAGDPWQGEVALAADDGPPGVLLEQFSPVRDHAGRVIHAVGLVQDVTVRRRMEAELRRAGEEQTRESDVLRAHLSAVNRDLEMFAYAVSHDLRAPLRAIDFFGRELVDQAKPGLDEESRGYMDRIFDARRRMAQIIDGMMNLFHLGRGELRRVDLDVTGLAEDAIGELRRGHPGRQVAVSVQRGMKTRGDLRLVQAAVASLLDNAWKFTARRQDARIEVGANDTPEGRVFFVRDNGAGFDMAYADRLFTAIRRLHTQDEFEGCGIGLVAVQRVIQRHHGRVWVEAAEGKGATFYFTLGPEGLGGGATPAPEPGGSGV